MAKISARGAKEVLRATTKPRTLGREGLVSESQFLLRTDRVVLHRSRSIAKPGEPKERWPKWKVLGKVPAKHEGADAKVLGEWIARNVIESRNMETKEISYGK